MSIPAVAQSLTPAVTNAVTQGVLTFSGHVYAIYQYTRLAAPTLVFTTTIGTLIGGAILVFNIETVNMIVKKIFDPDTAHKYGLPIFIGSFSIITLPIVSALNIGTSKLLKLPFSRLSSIAITLTTMFVVAAGSFAFIIYMSDD